MAKATDKKAAAPAAKSTAKPAAKAAPSKLVPDAKGNYQFQLYSVRVKTFVDIAKDPKPVLSPTGRGAYMCKGYDTEGNNLATIVSKVVAENWVSRNLAEWAE